MELTARGHSVSVTIASSDRAMIDAVERERPDLIVSPMLKRAIPESLWRRQVCLIVHPGPLGDRRASSLDWAITEGAPRWGVTVLQADAEFDAGDIWATRECPMRAATKSSLYREEVVEAAIGAPLEAVERYGRGQRHGTPLDYGRPEVWGRLRPNMKQAERRIDWSAPTAEILPRLRAADSNPGVLDRIEDLDLFLFGGQEEGTLRGEQGALLGWRDGAICRATGDGAIWITGRSVARRAGSRGSSSRPPSPWGICGCTACPTCPSRPMRRWRDGPTARSGTRSAARSASSTSPSSTAR